jgi:hypothetical protein
MARIGVFWIYKETVLGKSAGPNEGHESVPGIIDSPYDHVDFWEHDPSFVQPFPELRVSDRPSRPSPLRYEVGISHRLPRQGADERPQSRPDR